MIVKLFPNGRGWPAEYVELPDHVVRHSVLAAETVERVRREPDVPVYDYDPHRQAWHRGR